MADDPDKSFLADMNGIFAQHAAMWSVYTESIKILVSVTSLPILAAAVLLSVTRDASAAKSIDFTNLPPVLYWTLFILPVLDLLLVGVVIQHRLVILFYARALNGYRKIYLDQWRPSHSTEPAWPMPIDSKYPPNFEPAGPMGLIVHGSGFLNALYIFGATYTLWHSLSWSLVCAAATLTIYEGWYALHCHRAFRMRDKVQLGPAPSVVPVLKPDNIEAKAAPTTPPDDP